MIGQGTRFYRSNTGGTAIADWDQIAKVLDLTPPSMTRGSSENSYLENVNNSKNFEPGIIDPGESEITLEWDKADAAQTALKSDVTTKSNFWYGIRFPDDTFYVFKGHITDWGMDLSKEETIKRKVKFKLADIVDEDRNFPVA